MIQTATRKALRKRSRNAAKQFGQGPTTTHGQGPRALRRSFGLTNKNVVVRLVDYYSEVDNGRKITSMTPSTRALKRASYISDGPGARLAAHQRGAGFQHHGSHLALDEAASFNV